MTSLPKVGQILWLAHGDDRNRKQDHSIRVTKVGSKWANFTRADGGGYGDGRFDHTDPRWLVEREFGREDRVYVDELEWTRQEVAHDALIALRAATQWGRLRPDVREAHVREAARLLGVEEGFEKELVRIHQRRREEIRR